MEQKTTIVSNIPVSQNFLPQPITVDQYVLGDGNLPGEVLMPDGNWEAYLPEGETQSKNGIDPQSCPAGGTLNCIEMIGKRKYGKSFQNNLSERYLSVMMGMNGNGGYPHLAAETIRNGAGCIPEVFLPFDSSVTTLRKYFWPKPMAYALFKVGWHWNKVYDFKHEWVFLGGTITEKQARIKEALKYSPLGVSGYAWSLHSDDKYYKDGPDIHWFNIIKSVDKDHQKAFDTYPPYIKKLDWNYDFGYAKRYSLNRRLGSENINTGKPGSAIIPYIIYRIKSLFKLI